MINIIFKEINLLLVTESQKCLNCPLMGQLRCENKCSNFLDCLFYIIRREINLRIHRESFFKLCTVETKPTFLHWNCGRHIHFRLSLYCNHKTIENLYLSFIKLASLESEDIGDSLRRIPTFWKILACTCGRSNQLGTW